MLLIKLNKVLIKEGLKTELRKNYTSKLFNINTIFMDNMQIDDELVIHTKKEKNKINLWDIMSHNPMTIENLLESIGSLSKKDRIIVRKIIAILQRDFKSYMKEIIEFNEQDKKGIKTL